MSYAFDFDMGHEFSNQNQMVYASTLIDWIQNFKVEIWSFDLDPTNSNIDCVIYGWVKSKFNLDLLHSYGHYNHIWIKIEWLIFWFIKKNVGSWILI